MNKIIECVPNFSEGRDRKKINLIAAEIKKVKGVKVLDIDINADYNRTVITFIGGVRGVELAAFNAIAKALEFIDMSSHRGEHPRIGACDVCPFVPIKNATMAECVEIARRLGQRIGKELKIPVFLYEEAAARPERKDLAEIRKGEYEGLEKKLADSNWQPDYGQALFNKKSGAIVIGAREPLIAFNVNLKADSKRAADIIAGLIRESGWILISRDNKKVRIPGVFKAVKAIGISLQDRGIYQVSTNLTDYKITPLHIVFETIKRISPGLAEVLGSEIVGLVPKEAILMAGRFYSPAAAPGGGEPRPEESGRDKSEKRLIEIAKENLGLDSLKIIEYLIREEPEALQKLAIEEFLKELASKKAVPGGGSACALSGALAAGLVVMAAKISGKKKIAEKSERLMKVLIDLIDKDAKAFAGGDMKEATEIPLQTARYNYEVLKLVEALLENCNPNVITDLGVAAKMAEAVVEGALLNVKVNLLSIKDEEFKKEIEEAAEKLYLTGYRTRLLLSKIKVRLN